MVGFAGAILGAVIDGLVANFMGSMSTCYSPIFDSDYGSSNNNDAIAAKECSAINGHINYSPPPFNYLTKTTNGNYCDCVLTGGCTAGQSYCTTIPAYKSQYSCYRYITIFIDIHCVYLLLL